MHNLRLLVISDLHRSITKEQQALIDTYSSDVDLIVSLGDTPVETISRVDFGVLGNPDPLRGLAPEKDLHLAVKTVKGYTLTGVQGSIRYKDGNYVMYTQDEARGLAIPRADILISHDSSSYGRDADDDVHCGLQALTDYIIAYQPLLHLHGHHHESKVYQMGRTLCVSVYKCALVQISNGSVSVEEVF